MATIAYKVVTHALRSAVALGKYSLYYGEGVVVRPLPGTLGLMAFDTLQHAREFAVDCFYHHRILEVKYPAAAKLPPSPICPGPYGADLDRFYELGAPILLFADSPPPGTIFLSSLTVIKEVLP